MLLRGDRNVGRTPTENSDQRCWTTGFLQPQTQVVNSYLVFTYYANRPLGGINDFLGSFESLEEALDNILDEPNRYYQVVDFETMEVVKQGLAQFKSYDPGEFERENRDVFPGE